MNNKTIIWVIGIKIFLVIYTIIAWFINLFHFLNCDFESPYKEEFIKALGVFMPPVSAITVWF